MPRENLDKGLICSRDLAVLKFQGSGDDHLLKSTKCNFALVYLCLLGAGWCWGEYKWRVLCQYKYNRLATSLQVLCSSKSWLGCYEAKTLMTLAIYHHRFTTIANCLSAWEHPFLPLSSQYFTMTLYFQFLCLEKTFAFSISQSEMFKGAHPSTILLWK